jgi:hypothetical protein
MIKTDELQSKALKIPAAGCREYARSCIRLPVKLPNKERSAVIGLAADLIGIKNRCYGEQEFPPVTLQPPWLRSHRLSGTPHYLVDE